MKSAIIDASVALKWFYQDEEMGENANFIPHTQKVKNADSTKYWVCSGVMIQTT